MAGADKNGQDRQRETLDEFAARFGQLADRYEQALVPELERQDLPTAEHPDAIAAREAVQEQDNVPREGDIQSDVKPQPDFTAAAHDKSYEDRQGDGSDQVKKDAPEHNLPPPRDEEVDRRAHQQRMSKDDEKAKSEPEPKDDYMDRILETLESQRDERGQDREQDYGRDHGYDR